MRRMAFLSVLASVAALGAVGWPSAGLAAEKAGKTAEETECHGTTVDFWDSPVAAARQAQKKEKLVFVLHVSGNFETPDFT